MRNTFVVAFRNSMENRKSRMVLNVGDTLLDLRHSGFQSVQLAHS